jgi:hypothetical protein
MEPIQHDKLKELAMANGGPCVSIYMPLRWAPDERDKNRIRLKNMINAAQDNLEKEFKLGTSESEKLLAPAAALIEGGRFKGIGGDGLALFLSNTVEEQISAPLEFEEMLRIANQFHLQPLLKLFDTGNQYYLLALSQGSIRLFKGDRFQLKPLMLGDDVPESLESALFEDDPEKRLQWHSSTGSDGTPGDRPASFHGHGVTNKEEDKDQILRYFNKVDDGIMQIIAGDELPMLLAGVEYLLPIYRKASSYPHLVNEELRGNVEHLTAEELYQQAWQQMSLRHDQWRQKQLDEYAELEDSALATDSLEKIVPAASYGQVKTLFVAESRSRWGRFDKESGEVTTGDMTSADSIDLVNYAAVQTVLNGGQILIMEEGTMPTGKPAAALLRYSSS